MPHRLDRVGGCRQSQLGVDAAGSVMMDVSEKLAHRHAHLPCRQRLAHRGSQAPEGSLKERTVRELQRLASQLVQTLSDCPASQSGLFAAAAPLELADEVKMTELEDPAVVASERFHPSQVVADQSPNAAFGLGGDRPQDLAPELGTLATPEQQGIQKHRRVLGAGVERHQRPHAKAAAKTKPQPVDQEDEVPCGIFAGTRLREKLTQRVAKALADGLGRQGCSAQEHPQGLIGPKDSVQEVQPVSAMRAPASVLPNPPRSPAPAALPTPHPVRINSGPTTRGFRVCMVFMHANYRPKHGQTMRNTREIVDHGPPN